MGIVIRQSIKYSILSAIGSLIGALSVLFIYPLDLSLYGYANGVNSLIVFSAPILGFSSNAILTKYFHSKSINAGQTLSISFVFTCIFSITLSLFIFFAQKPIFDILQKTGYNTIFLKENLLFILIGGITLAFISLLTNLSANFQRTVVPNLLLNLGVKLVFPLLILGAYFTLLPKTSVSWILIAYYGVALLFLFFYLFKIAQKRDFRFEKFKFKSIPKSLFTFTFISGFTGLANLLASKLDILALAGFGSLEDIGKYSIIFFIASFIEIPMAGISSISAPIIAKHLEEKEFTELNLLLKKVSNTLFLSGTFLFIILGSIFQNLGDISGHSELFSKGINVFLILGLAKLVDMVTSLNTHAISYSKLYHYNLYFVIISAVFNVFLTYYFTTKMGITGTALSILISITLFNFLKFILLKMSFDLNPFSSATFKILLILIILSCTNYWIQPNLNPILELILKGSLSVIIFLILLKIIKPIPEVDEKMFSKNGLLRNIFKKNYIRKNLGF